MAKQNELNLDNWNERLDKNLEPEKTGDTTADERAEEFSEKYGSNAHTPPVSSDTDNMQQNQPVPGTPDDGDIDREE